MPHNFSKIMEKGVSPMTHPTAVPHEFTLEKMTRIRAELPGHYSYGRDENGRDEVGKQGPERG